ncbi:MAG: TolC family protein [Bacteroidales bacterium]|nr:TolC family protein [Bacteroidales bacterium]
MECIDYALQHNIDVKKLQLQQSIASNNLVQSKQNILPSLNGFANYSATSAMFITPEAKPFIENSTRAGNIGLAVELDVFKGLYNVNNIKKQDLLLQISNQNVASVQSTIMLEVATAFMYIIYNNEKLKTIDLQMQRTMQQLEVTRKFFAAGECTEADALQKLHINNEIDNRKLALAQAMEVKLDTVSDIALGLELPLIESFVTQQTIEELLSKACAIRPEIVLAQTNIKVKETDIALSRSAALPSLSVGYNVYTSSNAPGFYNYQDMTIYQEKMFNNFYGNFSARLTVPIFNKFTVKHDLANKKIEKQVAEFDLQNSNKELYNAISIAFRNLNTAKMEYDKQLKILELTKKTYFIAEKQNEVGEISSYEFLLEKNKLNETEISLLISKYEFLFNKMVLDFYTTNRITM